MGGGTRDGDDGATADPYEDDILGRSADQAARLRRCAAGDAPPGEAGVTGPT